MIEATAAANLQNDVQFHILSSVWSDGGKYVGEFKNGEINGLGTKILSDGNKYQGEWKEGKTLAGIIYDGSGKILYKLLNGERQ